MLGTRPAKMFLSKNEMQTSPEQGNVKVQTSPLFQKKRLGFWLLGIVLLVVLLLAVSFLLAAHLLFSTSGKEQIQQTLVARTGIEIGYEKIGIGYFPTPTLELHQLTFSLPDKLKGRADTLRIMPKITQLLVGKLDLGKVELDRPDINLELVEPQSAGSPDLSFASLLSVLPALHLNITDGRFSVAAGTRNFAGEHLDLTLDGAIENARAGSATLKIALAELAVRSGERREIIKGVQLKGNIRADDGNLTCRLDRLFVANPALTLAGNLVRAPVAEGITLSLSGTDIDVEATRKTALALAGDIAPVSEIFTYLAGGTVPQIKFTSRGKSISELGDLENIRIEGQLQDGAIAIPEMAMNLT